MHVLPFICNILQRGYKEKKQPNCTAEYCSQCLPNRNRKCKPEPGSTQGRVKYG